MKKRRKNLIQATTRFRYNKDILVFLQPDHNVTVVRIKPIFQWFLVRGLSAQILVELPLQTTSRGLFESKIEVRKIEKLLRELVKAKIIETSP